MRSGYLAFIASSVLSLAVHVNACFAEAAAPAPVPVGMATRLVVLFADLEKNIQTAIERGDQTRLEDLLSDDFEMWAGPRPGEPIPKIDWLKESMAHPEAAKFKRIEELVAKDFGDIVVVSFKWAGKADIFVVDIWKKVDASWKLTTRYAGAAGSLDLGIPGVVRQASKFPKKF